LFAKVGELLLANGMKLSGGTIVDATLITAPPSTKNQEQSRDPEMPWAQQSNWSAFLVSGESHYVQQLAIDVDDVASVRALRLA
jgi:hypothetical protein